jgi:hypothetical protein
MTSQKDDLLTEIQQIHLGVPSSKPHKLLLLLAVAKLYEKSELCGNKIQYNDVLYKAFSDVFDKYARDTDRKRPYTPFFHLRTMSFWKLVAHKGEELELAQTETIGGPKQLAELVDDVEISDTFVSILCNDEDNHRLQDMIINELTLYCQGSGNGDEIMNPFVSYLNTLHCTDANSKGGLAESQALEPLFCDIQVSHPCGKPIFDALVGSAGARVILSGHAGDGKSTLALELLKRLKGIPSGDALPDGLRKKEIVGGMPHEIVVVKDLSEWREDERNSLLRELLEDTSRSYLLVSNTGTLLDFFKRRQDDIHLNPVEIENALLTALDSERMQHMTLGVPFQVYNLARMDNLDIAMSLFDRMIDADAWRTCAECAAFDHCPIALNRRIMLNYRVPVRERIHHLYYRSYAYGQRLTLRQITAHFAYLVTGGQDCHAVKQAIESGRTPPLGTHLFVNRFWGDNGWEPDAKAVQLQAIRVFDSQGFNTQTSPSQERVFWQPEGGGAFDLRIPELQTCVSRLQKSARNASEPDKAASARRQLRRLAFFLHRPDVSQLKRFERFQTAFLNSPMLLRYQAWQVDPAVFKPRDLQPALFAVLQEQFCGFLPPEGPARSGELYITLNRQSPDIRQSVQLVLRHFKFSALFDIRMEGMRLVLRGKGVASNIVLPITLPFLDYIVSRKAGEIGRGLELSYRDRLEKLMAQLLKLLPGDEDEALTLLKRAENGTLATISVRKYHDMLEVFHD